MIEVRDISVKRGAFSLNELSVKVEEGESFALLGPSGAGKTLFLETVLGLRRPNSGTVKVRNRIVHDIPPEERSVAFLPQDLALFPHLSVFENIAFCLRLANMDENSVKKRVEELSQKLAISKLLSREDVHSLSGGEKQRVALARALAGRPRLLFLDEPFCALDGARRRDLHREVRAVQKSLGLTMLFVTHDLEEALVMADKVALMREGNIVQQGPPKEVFGQPNTAWAAHFLLFENVFSANINKEGTCKVDGQELSFSTSETHENGKRAFAIKAEDFTLKAGPPCFVEAIVGSPLPFGAGEVLPFRLADDESAQEFLMTFDSSALGREVPAEGTSCKVYYDGDDIRVLEALDGG